MSDRPLAVWVTSCEDEGMNSIVVVVFALGWILIGIITGLWMSRRGHSPIWTVIAVALGPLFVPIAYERVERRPLPAASGPSGTESDSTMSSKARILIGLDGSAEADRAIGAALDLMGDRCGALMLAEVVSYDDAREGDSMKMIEAATERLASAASRIVDVPTEYEVLAGPPGETLRRSPKNRAWTCLSSAGAVVVARLGCWAACPQIWCSTPGYRCS